MEVGTTTLEGTRHDPQTTYIFATGRHAVVDSRRSDPVAVIPLDANLPGGMTMELRLIGPEHYFVVLGPDNNMLSVNHVDMRTPQEEEAGGVGVDYADLKADHETNVFSTWKETVVVVTTLMRRVDGTLVQVRVTVIRVPLEDQTEPDA